MTYPVVELNGFDNSLIGVQQGPNVFLVRDDLDVSNDGSPRHLGFVEIVLYFGTLSNVFNLSIDKLDKMG